MKPVTFFAILLLATASFAQAPAAKAPTPTLSADQLKDFYKADDRLNQAQAALDAARTNMSSIIADLAKTCGDQFTLQLNPNPGPTQGDPMCVPKPAVSAPAATPQQ